MKLYYFMLIFFVLSFVSANGLNISNQNQIINKIAGENTTMSFSISNQESFSFYNISAEDNNYIYFTPLTSLGSGQTINITAIVKNDLFNQSQSLRIRGYYLNNIGIRNQTTNINVNWDTQSTCDVTITEGDSINFTNIGDYEMSVLLNFGTMSLLSKESKIQKYETTGNYYFKRKVGALQFETCNIKVLSSTGYVNNPLLDGILNYTINSNYRNTNLTTTVYATDYSINFSSTDEGVIIFTNSGSETAKNVSLSGEWFMFNNNNFDIEPGLTKSIIYTINPIILSTNDTNKTYEKYLNVKGNFDSYSVKFKITIPYAVIATGDFNSSNMSLVDWLCQQKPEFCNPQIVYKYISNGSGDSSNVSVTDEMWKDYNLELYKSREELKTALNYIKESDANKTDALNEVKDQMKNQTVEYNRNKTESETQTTLIISFLLVLLLGSICGITFFLIKYYKTEKIIEEQTSW